MKKQLLLLAMALLPMVAWGKVVKIGKVWYDYDYDKETAEVVAPPSEDEKYEGDIEISQFY